MSSFKNGLNIQKKVRVYCQTDLFRIINSYHERQPDIKHTVNSSLNKAAIVDSKTSKNKWDLY